MSYGFQDIAFSLQYFRSSVTVPLYFKRREKIDINREFDVPEINKRLKVRKFAIYSSQAVVILLWIISSSFGFLNHGTPTTVIASVIAVLYAISLTLIFFASYRIHRWKQREFTHLGYRWSREKDGLFLFYAILLVTHFILIVFSLKAICEGCPPPIFCYIST